MPTSLVVKNGSKMRSGWEIPGPLSRKETSTKSPRLAVVISMRAGRPVSPHRVVGVVQDVQEHLLQLVRISDDLGQRLVEVLDHLDAVALEVVGAQLHGALQDGIQLHRLALRRHLAGKAEQILHDLLGALRLLQNHPQILARALRNFRILHQQVGKSQNGGERIVDFVGDAGDQLSDRRHLSRRASAWTAAWRRR